MENNPAQAPIAPPEPQPVPPVTLPVSEPKKGLPKKIIATIFGIIVIIICVALIPFFYKNFVSSCTITWASFPTDISSNTDYTIYINKVSTSHKWRDVSVFKDLDIQNSNAYREPGLTGDSWDKPSSTYTLTFNSGEVGTHKLYFYNNDFKSYGEKSGTGPRTLCDPVFTFTTNNVVVKPTPTPPANLNPELVGKVYWDLSSPKSSEADTEIKNAFKSYAPSDSDLSDDRRLTVVGIFTSTLSANFAIAGMELRDKNNQIIPTDGFGSYLYKAGNIWNIMSAGDTSFCNVIKTFPNDLISDYDITQYYGCPK